MEGVLRLDMLMAGSHVSGLNGVLLYRLSGRVNKEIKKRRERQRCVCGVGQQAFRLRQDPSEHGVTLI